MDVSSQGDGGGGPLRRLQRRMHANRATALATKVVVGLVGLALVAAGVVMLVAPGPGVVAILLGLAVWATEFVWAERLLDRAKAAAKRAKQRAEEMDPALRRRRVLLTLGAAVVLVGALGGYVAAYGWPTLAVTGWDRVQGMAEWIPELPGM